MKHPENLPDPVPALEARIFALEKEVKRLRKDIQDHQHNERGTTWYPPLEWQY